MELTTHERVSRMYQHKEADHVPFLDWPWNGTLARWYREGLPKGMDWRDYFHVDKSSSIDVDISPRYEHKILEENDRYIIHTTSWGMTEKEFKEMDSTPEILGARVVTPEAWEECKARMLQDDGTRINWNYLKENYPKWRAENQWVDATFWFGFDVTHSHMVGTETMLIAMIEEPDWVKDMFETYLDCNIRLFNQIWDAGYHFDSILFYDDMGYKNTTFFSSKMYRSLLQPYHRKAVEWAHNHGIYARLHSCGDIMTLLPDIVDTGVDGLNPMEVKAGMDPLKIKKEYGDKLLLHGGYNAVWWNDSPKITSEIRRTLPILKENGGYIFASDHSIPNSVSFQNMTDVVNAWKEAGSYT